MASTDDFDVCVIGTGASGGVMLDQLTAAGMRVVALQRLSNARKDRHLSLIPVERGLAAPLYYPGTGNPAPIAGIRVDIDYAEPGIAYFVSDVATDPALTGGVRPGRYMQRKISSRLSASRADTISP